MDRSKHALLFPVISLSALAACSGWPRVPEPPPAPPPETPAESPPPQTVVVRDPELEQQLARSRLQLLEKEAQIEALQARLDAARQEVVRAMAKQQSQASRAEAASAIAEAEIALQSLNAAGVGAGDVGRLVELATGEFDRRNYAGALYLAGQAKGAAFAAHGPGEGQDRGATRSGERTFAGPLRLQTSAGSNVREGPGLGFRVLFTLPKGAAVTGLSHANQWVRITDDSGREGWIYQPLIVRPP